MGEKTARDEIASRVKAWLDVYLLRPAPVYGLRADHGKAGAVAPAPKIDLELGRPLLASAFEEPRPF